MQLIAYGGGGFRPVLSAPRTGYARQIKETVVVVIVVIVVVVIVVIVVVVIVVIVVIK